jgi:glycerol-3-phosphate dehydrogenase
MSWNATWREAALPELAARDWDLIVVGGGISGAGILREAARRGWSCLLLEQRDFAWGTSSRSSKMVHGGLRYIAKGQLGLTRDSVRERQRLLGEAPGLVDALPFLFPHYRGQFPGPRVFGGLLGVYDALAGQRLHRYHPAAELRYLAPGLNDAELLGGTLFTDAVTDDARLVMRVLGEARAEGGEALNGLRVIELSRDGERVNGLVRPLRGSHLLLPAWRLPVAQAISFMHPEDQRPVFVFPWEGATVIGTTDLDHGEALNRDARITEAEVEYLLAACASVLPQAKVGRADVLSTWAGVRPVVSEGESSGKKPSDEKREHALWVEPGCVTLAGGKLTTFRLLALEVLRACAPMLGREVADVGQAVFHAAPPVALPGLCLSQQRRLAGRHGRALPRLAELIGELGSEYIGASTTLWAELALACDDELVLQLDDLLLRRTRIGLLLAGGAAAELPRIRALCQPRLGWSDARWEEQQQRYLALWRQCYSLPGESS